MIVTDKEIIKKYRNKKINNKDGFCIGDKVIYQNSSDEEYFYVVSVNNGSILITTKDRTKIMIEKFPDRNLKILKKCEKYPYDIINKFCPSLSKSETVELINLLEGNENRGMNFFEAMQELEKGNKVRNTTWREGYYIFVDKDNLLTDSNGLAYEIHIESYDDLKYFLWWNKGSWEVFE